MISVVIPTYKRPDLLKRLLTSISQQSVQPEEVIIVDDCSGMTLEYSEVINEFSTILANLKYFSLESNSGASTARNKGIYESTQPWIALVDDDDEWLPEKLAEQKKLITQSTDEKLGLVYTWTEAQGVGEQASYTSCISVKGDARKALLTTNFIMSASVMVKREAIIEVNCFDVALPSCQDWDMWIRICLAGYHIDVVEKILTIHHRHGGESIGLSPKAKLGYKLLLESHWREIYKHTNIKNIVKKVILYIEVKVKTNGLRIK
ncbi:glycosyltransferase family A protein [Motilimonas sp. 1_MG-2023]|uniref:glycosyltransferase family 2 protein n=1 Tax=Motilimonas sp. 1_MG-2023 TaxID=3062672 RepID=UPI0026E45A6E|nr:glycosyltransferase family A protein [Motilimonas sp. 1_MG-2023]MDO6527446.1 glycosyltransferase family A protein [Motilimonas sp. 1_MG-2023]